VKKLVVVEPNKAVIIDYEDRQVNSDEVKIKVDFASPKHGTEIADFNGTTPFINGKYDPEWQVFTQRTADEPRGIVYGDLPIGNMVVGNVIERGSEVTAYTIGDRVTVYGPVRETVIVKGVNNYKLRHLPEGMAPSQAVLYDPAQFALGGIRDSTVSPGDFVAVIGLGAIGLIACQLAKRAGASTVIAVDPIVKRREVALALGADLVLDSLQCDVGLEIKKVTGKIGCDQIIETSGNMHALQASIKGLAYGGTIAYVAFAKPFPQGLWLGQEAHFNNGKIVFSRASSEPNPDYPRWNRKRIEDTCWQMLSNKYINAEQIIDPIVPFSESAEAFTHYVAQHPEESIKMGIQF
jgi:threonine dehydrogenase-like Zn-dependent dehydrogenase